MKCNNCFRLLGILTGFSLLSLAPVRAVNITRSDLFLELTDFNRPAIGTVAIGDNRVVNLAEGGISEGGIQGDAFFTSDSQETIVRSVFSNRTIGFGNRYLGLADLNTSLGGIFIVPAGETLRFNIEMAIGQVTDRTDAVSTALSSASQIVLEFLEDPALIFPNSVATPTKIDGFSFLSQLNTNSEDFFQPDYFRFSISSNIAVVDRFERAIVSDTSATASAFLRGTFQWVAPRDTALLLVATTRSCTYSSDQPDVCVTIPEPRTSPIVWWVTGGILLLSRLIDQVI